MPKRRIGPLMAVVGGVAWLGWFAPEAHGQKAFLNVARGLYGLDASYGKCHLCHESRRGPNRQTLNDLGKALQGMDGMQPLLGKNSSYAFNAQELQAVADALKKLDTADTDGDGATNREELLLKTFPADANSKPAAAALEQLRAWEAKRAAEAAGKK